MDWKEQRNGAADQELKNKHREELPGDVTNITLPIIEKSHKRWRKEKVVVATSTVAGTAEK